jgi:ribose transport system substrate-binding protein
MQAIGSRGKIYLQEGSPGDPISEQRELGCKHAVEATHGQFVLTGVGYNNNAVEQAAQQTAAALQQDTDLQGIFSGNMAGARGASVALAQAGLSGKVRLAVFDATDDAIQDLRDQKLDLVITQKPAEMASRAIEFAAKLLKGDATGIPKRVKTGFVVIDRDNVDTPEAQGAMYKFCHCSVLP